MILVSFKLIKKQSHEFWDCFLYFCSMDIQKILVYLSLAIAVGFLVKKFFWKKRPKKSKPCGDDCACH